MWKLWKSLLLPAVATGQTPTVGGGGDVHAHYRGHLWSLSPDGDLHWRFDGPLVSHIEDAHGAVYALMAKDENATVALASIAAETGSVRWILKQDCNASCGGFLKEAPISKDGTVYVTLLGQSDGMGRYISPSTVQAVSADGHVKWVSTFSASGSSCDTCSLYPPVLGNDGTVFVTQRGSLQALRPENGTPKWSIQDAAMDGGFIGSGIAVGRDGTVYVIPRVVNGTTSLLIINRDGSVRVKMTLEACGDDSHIRTPYVGFRWFHGNVVYIDGVRCGGNVKSCGVCAFDHEGELLWKRDESSLLSVRNDGAMKSDVLLTRKYGDYSERVSTVAAINGYGSMLWEANISNDYGATVYSSKDHTYYFSDSVSYRRGPGKVLALRNGKELWHTDLHTEHRAARLAVTQHGMVYAQFERTNNGPDWYFQLAAIGNNGSQMWHFAADVPNLAMAV